MRAVLVSILLAASPASAQPGYPAKAVRLIVPSTPGSPPDVMARVMAERLAPALGQPVVVENRFGAMGTIGLNAVAKAAPDGHTLGMMALPFALGPLLLGHAPYQTSTDLATVGQVAWSSQILVVRMSLPVSSVAELIAFARANPGAVTYASAGNGTPGHLAGELLKLRAGVDIRHVPFKGTQGGVTALLGEQVEMNFAATVAVAAHIRAGKLRALATLTPRRVPSFAEVPTLEETGFPGFHLRDWLGIVTAAGTPRAAVAVLEGEIARMLAAPDMRQRLGALGMEPPEDLGAERFGALLRSEVERWGELIKDAGIRAE
jgi:tripartite-type tricarboxylate transporter receptor subunit TctC